MIEKPDIPEPQRAPSDAAKPSGAPHQNGNGEGAADTPTHPGQDKWIAWVEATDKEVKMLRLTQLVLCGAVLALMVTVAKSKGLGGIPSV